MTTELLQPRIDATQAPDTRVRGLICRNCRTPTALGASYVCEACFGPLEVDYDLGAIDILIAGIVAHWELG